MFLKRENAIGEISVSNNIFAQIIRDSFKLCEGRVWPATKKCKQIGTDNKFSLTDFSSTIESLETGEGIELKFYVIIKFGASIKEITDKLTNYIFQNVKTTIGEYPYKVTISVVGVKSKQIAKRDVEVVKLNEFRW